MVIVLGMFVGLALLLFPFLDEEIVANHLADDLLGASLRFFPDLRHALLVPMAG
jgi:hypothetical protein